MTALRGKGRALQFADVVPPKPAPEASAGSGQGRN